MIKDIGQGDLPIGLVRVSFEALSKALGLDGVVRIS